MNPELNEILHQITGGNPGALNVCMAIIIGTEPPSLASIILHSLRALEISGPQIWMLYKDESGQDINQFNRLVLGKVLDLLPQ